MNRALLLDASQTRAALPPDALLTAVRGALIATGRGEVSAPDRIAARSPAGLLGAMPGYVPGLGMAGKLTSVFPAAGGAGRSAHQGIVALFDPDDGRLCAVMSGEVVTALRTAASATVAFLALMPPDLAGIAVIGAGAQARAQLELLTHLGPPAPVVVASRSPGPARELAARYGVSVADSIQEAVAGADAVFCCTDSDRPVLDHDWLRPHAHVSSVGGSRGPELDQATVRAGRLFVEWPGAVTSPPPAGAHELQSLPDGQAELIGSVLARRTDRKPDESTVFKSTGYAGLDVAAAAVAYRTAVAAGTGTWVAL